MSLCEGQLAEFALPRPDEAGIAAYAISEVRAALENSAHMDGVDYEVLQTGSSRNCTNINTSDVDLLVVFGGADRHRSATTAERFTRWSAFSGLVEEAVAGHMGRGNVVRRNKCIDVERHPDLPQIDIVPCLPTFQNIPDLRLHEQVPADGVEFWTTHDRPANHIISFRERHVANGNAKDERTEGKYKEAVRALKAIKAGHVESDIRPEDVPSYHLECSLYSLPDSAFESGVRNALQRMTKYFLEPNRRDTNPLIAVNHAYRLLGHGILQWRQEHAQRFFGLVADIL